MPHLGFEIIAAAAKHPTVAGKPGRQGFVLPEVAVGNFRHIEEQAGLQSHAPVLIELAEDVYIQDLAHQEKIRFAASFLQSRRAKADQPGNAGEVVGVGVLGGSGNRVLIKAGDLKITDPVLTPSSRWNGDPEAD